MTLSSFLNDNEYRQYPLIPTAVPHVENDLIVDCGFIMGIDSGHIPETHVVYLAAIRRQGNVLEIEFRTTAPNAANQPLTFLRNLNAEEWEEEYVEAPAADVPCATEPLWSGFFVSGVLATTANKMPNGAVSSFTPAQTAVEPGRVQTLVKSYLRSISVGNYARLVIPPCSGGQNTAIAQPTEIIPNGECIFGHVKLKPGYNCEITQQDFANTLAVAAVRAANTTNPAAAELCQYGSEIKTHDNEIPPILTAGSPERSKFLSGGLACDQTITSINGLSGPNVRIVGGAGLEVVPDPANPNGLLLRIQDNIVNKVC